MDWQDEYKNKFITAEKAASMVKSGDKIAFTMGREAFGVGLAIASRIGELKDVEVYIGTPGYDFGWYDDGWDESFHTTIGMPTATCQEAVDRKQTDLLILSAIEGMQQTEKPDVLLTEISTPDDKGFCSFGNSVWNKLRHIRQTREQGKIVIAEVNNSLMRTYGANSIHVSELDYFVEHISSGAAPGTGTLAGRAVREPDEKNKNITGYVNSLLKDRDVLQIGVGRTTEPMTRLGMLDGKHDIGYHSEATPSGIISLVQEGVITGKYKNIHTGKVVCTSIGGSTREEMNWVHMNPLFELVEFEYLEDVRVISAHDQMTAINNALMVDLTGQIAAETLGERILSQAGGQQPFVFGALQANRGKAITVLPSTAQNGTISRIANHLPSGTVVTIPRSYADYIITEYGIAHMRGKTLRQRADALIAIAHPDFRSELQKEANRRFWPDK